MLIEPASPHRVSGQLGHRWNDTVLLSRLAASTYHLDNVNETIVLNIIPEKFAKQWIYTWHPKVPSLT